MWRRGVRVTTSASRGGRKNPGTPSLPVCSCETVGEQETLIRSPIRSPESGCPSSGPTMCRARPSALRAAQLSETPDPSRRQDPTAGTRSSFGGSQEGGNLPGGSDGEESACRWGRPGFPWVGKIPWRRARPPTPGFSPGESRGQRSLVGHIQSTGYQRVGHDSARTK